MPSGMFIPCKKGDKDAILLPNKHHDWFLIRFRVREEAGEVSRDMGAWPLAEDYRCACSLRC